MPTQAGAGPGLNVHFRAAMKPTARWGQRAPPFISAISEVEHDYCNGRIAPTSPHLSYLPFPRWSGLSSRRFIAPLPIARWGQRAPPVRPIRFAGAQPLCHRIPPDVAPGLVPLLFMADAMIKIVGLPCDAVQTRHASLPVADNGRNAGFPREYQQGVQVIRHEQEQLAPPAARCVILHGCIDQETRQPELSQRSGLRGRCPDPDMEHRPIFHPSGCSVVQARRVFAHATTVRSRMMYSTRYFPPPKRVEDNAHHLLHTAGRNSQGGVPCPQGASSLPSRLCVGDNAHHQDLPVNPSPAHRP